MQERTLRRLCGCARVHPAHWTRAAPVAQGADLSALVVVGTHAGELPQRRHQQGCQEHADGGEHCAANALAGQLGQLHARPGHRRWAQQGEPHGGNPRAQQQRREAVGQHRTLAGALISPARSDSWEAFLGHPTVGQGNRGMAHIAALRAAASRLLLPGTAASPRELSKLLAIPWLWSASTGQQHSPHQCRGTGSLSAGQLGSDLGRASPSALLDAAARHSRKDQLPGWPQVQALLRGSVVASLLEAVCLQQGLQRPLQQCSSSSHLPSGSGLALQEVQPLHESRRTVAQAAPAPAPAPGQPPVTDDEKLRLKAQVSWCRQPGPEPGLAPGLEPNPELHANSTYTSRAAMITRLPGARLGPGA